MFKDEATILCNSHTQTAGATWIPFWMSEASLPPDFFHHPPQSVKNVFWPPWASPDHFELNNLETASKNTPDAATLTLHARNS